MTIWDWIAECVERMDVVVQGSSDLFLQLDNWGFYTRKQSRSSIESKPSHPIICNALLFQLHQPGKPTYQKQLKYSPLNKGTIADGQDVDRLDYTGPTYRFVKDIPDGFCSIENLASHPDLARPDAQVKAHNITSAVYCHAKGLAQEIFVVFWQECLYRQLTFIDPGSISKQYVDSESVKDGKIKVKVCPICNLQNNYRQNTCADCKTLLDGIDVYRAAAREASSGSPGSVYMQWKSRSKIDMDVRVTRLNFDEKTGKQVVTHDLIFDPNDGGQDFMEDGSEATKPTMDVTFLPAVPINPSGEDNLRRILLQYGKLARLQNFFTPAEGDEDYGEVQRQYILWGTDQGAYNRALAREKEFQRFLPVPDTFHCEVAFMRCVHLISAAFHGPALEGTIMRVFLKLILV